MANIQINALKQATSIQDTDIMITEDALETNKITVKQLEDKIVKPTSEKLDTHITNKSNPHSVTKSQVGLSNVPNVTTNNQTPTFTEATTLTTLSSGEIITTAFGKIAKAISSLIAHISNVSNPHSVTKSQVGLGSVNNTADSAKNVLSATKLTTARTISLTGDVTGSVSFDGSSNSTITTTVADDSHNHVIGNVDNLQTVLDGKSPLSHTHTSANITDATNANTANTIVKRDSSGNFSAETVTGSLSGNASSATKLQTARTIALSGGATGTATSFNGTANIAIPVTSLDATKLSGTASISTTGNAGTATKLATARTIAGTSFDGTANINISYANLTNKPTIPEGVIVNNTLTSTSTTESLSANQGRILNTNKLDKTSIANNLATTESGLALDARQGKALKDGQDAINDNLAQLQGLVTKPFQGISTANGWETNGYARIIRVDKLVSGHLQVRNGTNTVGTIIGTIPVGYRPTQNVFITCSNFGTGSSNGSVNIGSDGTIKIQSVFTSITHVSIDFNYMGE